MTSHCNQRYRVACVVTKYLDVVISARSDDAALAQAEALYHDEGEPAFCHRDGDIDRHVARQTGSENGGQP